MKPGSKALRKLLRQLTAAPFQLKRHCRSDLTFECVGDGSDGLKDGKARVWLRPRIRVADELDLVPDLLIADAGLGVIGLVHVIEVPDKDLAAEANRDVDQATYLRDLLLAKGTVGGPEGSPLDYTVETVLVIAQGLAPAIAGVVRDILTKTRFLHATGLNLLSYSENVDFDPDELRRAFAWLLLVTRERLSDCKCPASGRLQGLRLSNYRLPGQRKWTLEASHNVHLVHGANGTGKSSMAEALELAVTGTVERIDRDHPDADYDRVIRNSHSEASAQVSVAFTTGGPPNFDFDVVKSGRISKPSLRPSLPVTAFRLDQTVMDELIRASSQQRARVLTRAFFPGRAYQELEKAHDTLVKAFHELPAEIQMEIQSGQPNSDEWPPILISRLGWVDDPSAPVVLGDVLPLPRPQLDLFAAIAPEIKDGLSKLDQPMDRPAFESMLQVLDEALNRVRAKVRAYRDAVVGSLAALARVGSWRPDSTKASMEYSHALREWAERLALRDLLQKSLDVTKTVAAARQDGWTAGPENGAGLMSLPTDVAGLTRAVKYCTKEQDEFLQQLQGGALAGTTGSTAASVTSLTSTEIDDLNLTGEWWSRQQATPPAEPCGTAIQKAISENKATWLGPIMVGSEKWADQLTAFLVPVSPALEALLAFDQPPSTLPDATPPQIYRSPVVRLNGFKTALACARTEDEAATQVDEILKKRLLELSPALDEIVTLLTPARWAYEGILVQAERRDGKAAVELVNSKTSSQADLRLNTAELNIIVLALYLLCGPTIDNPLSTIILDDPLQNMDELTAATVARGIAKIAAMMPEGWQLIIMFHGDEDLEAFSREVRGSVYRLPWLGPVGVVTSTDLTLDPARSRPKEEKQPRIGAIIQQSPRQLGATAL